MQNGFDYMIQSDSFISFDGWLMALNPVTIILDIIHWQKIRFVQLHICIHEGSQVCQSDLW